MTSGPTRAGRVHRLVGVLRQGSGDDALALGQVRRARVRWPAGDLARCVVLRAHEIAPARALRPVLMTDAPARRLWQRAFDDVLSRDDADLRAWVTAPRPVAHRCDGSVHRLQLGPDGLAALDHPGADLVAEAAAVALGATAASCIQRVLGWQQGQPPAREAVHLAGLLSLLRWAQVVGSWLAAGVHPSDAHPAVSAGLTPADLADHRAAGLSLPTAVAWHERPAVEVLRWRALGAGPEQADAWSAQGRSLQEAEQATRHVSSFVAACDWAERTGRRVPLAELCAWAASGRPATHWGEVAARGLTCAAVEPWTAAGFGPAAVLRWSHLGATPQEALRWQAAGVDGPRAAQLRALGMTPTDAARLRDVATADLVTWWPLAASVEGVRAGLAEQDRVEQDVPA